MLWSTHLKKFPDQAHQKHLFKRLKTHQKQGNNDTAVSTLLDPQEGIGLWLHMIAHGLLSTEEGIPQILSKVTQRLTQKLKRQPKTHPQKETIPTRQILSKWDWILLSARTLIIETLQHFKTERLTLNTQLGALIEDLKEREEDLHAITETLPPLREALEGWIRVNRSDEHLQEVILKLRPQLQGSDLEPKLTTLEEALQRATLAKQKLQDARKKIRAAGLSLNEEEGALELSRENLLQTQDRNLQYAQNTCRHLILELSFLQSLHAPNTSSKDTLKIALDGIKDPTLGHLKGHGDTLQRLLQRAFEDPSKSSKSTSKTQASSLWNHYLTLLQTQLSKIDPASTPSLRCWLHHQTLKLLKANTPDRARARLNHAALEARIATEHQHATFRRGIQIALEGYTPEPQRPRLFGYEEAILFWMRKRNPTDLLSDDLLIDAYQHCLEQICIYFPKFHWTSQFKTWAYRIAASAVSDLSRGELRYQPANEIDLEKALGRSRSHTKTIFQTTIRDQVRDVLTELLSKSEWSLLHLRDYLQFSFNEIATIAFIEEMDLNPSKSKVKRRAASMRQKHRRLRKRLAELSLGEDLKNR